MDAHFDFLNSTFPIEEQNLMKFKNIDFKHKETNKHKKPTISEVQSILFLFQKYFTPNFIDMNDVLYIEAIYQYNFFKDVDLLDLNREFEELASPYNFNINIHFKDPDLWVDKLYLFDKFDFNSFISDYLKLNINKNFSFKFNFGEEIDPQKIPIEISPINPLLKINIKRDLLKRKPVQISFEFKKINIFNKIKIYILNKTNIFKIK